ncbi:MAG: hypothetical protein K2P81_17730 [Bacteriovoracaceae bacterium]|nr:hypothetical protein [Bacteriovoracaceae bacterium]
MKMLLALGFIFSASVFAAGTVKVQVTLSPAGSFTAHSEKVRGFAEKSGSKYVAKELTVEVGTLKTDLDLRDEHFQKRLGGPKSKILIQNAVGENGKGVATMVANGKSNPISFVYKAEGSQIVARFNAKPSDFGITDVKYMGIGVEDKITIDATIPAR